MNRQNEMTTSIKCTLRTLRLSAALDTMRIVIIVCSKQAVK